MRGGRGSSGGHGMVAWGVHTQWPLPTGAAAARGVRSPCGGRSLAVLSDARALRWRHPPTPPWRPAPCDRASRARRLVPAPARGGSTGARARARIGRAAWEPQASQQTERPYSSSLRSAPAPRAERAAPLAMAALRVGSPGTLARSMPQTTESTPWVLVYVLSPMLGPLWTTDPK